MKSHTSLLLTALALGIACPNAYSKQAKTSITLNKAGQQLEADYEKQLTALKNEITGQLPTIEKQQTQAFANARAAEKAAEAKLKEAQDKLGKIRTAHALVGHAKGKWIGGANKGIAKANEMLNRAKTDTEKEAARKELAKWQQNLADGKAALKERQANYDRLKKNQPQAEKAVATAKKSLKAARIRPLTATKNLNLDRLLNNNRLDAKLAKYVLLKEATPKALAAYAQQGAKQKQQVDQLLNNDSLLIQIGIADGAKDANYGRALDIYSAIQSASPKAKDGTLQQLALAISLEHATPIAQRNAKARPNAPATVDPVKRYLHYEKAFLTKQLDPAFSRLTVWDMRMVVNGYEPDETLAWGRSMLRNYRPDHITTKDYRWRYVAIVRSDIRYGSQDNKYDKDELQFFQNILMNGGICGRRAFFGRFILRAFGIPTTARPQRGHASLAHWTPDGWVICLGGGWGAGWTKTQYDRDLDFLATAQARATGDAFLPVKRAQWIGDIMAEPRVFGLHGKKQPGFWYAVSLYTQKCIIAESKARTLKAVGEDIGEANETKEHVEIAKVKLTGDDRKVRIDDSGVITIPAAATSNPTKSNGKILFLESSLGGKQLHYSRTGRHQPFSYSIDVPLGGRYQLTARVVTTSWKQNLTLNVNKSKQDQNLPLPFTVGEWGKTAPLTIQLNKGANTLTFTRNGEVKGVTIKDFTLTPLMK